MTDTQSRWNYTPILFLLLVSAGCVLGIAYLIYSQEIAQKEKSGPKNAVMRKAQEELKRLQGEVEQEELPQKPRSFMETAKSVALLFGFALYYFLVVMVGPWIARDAYAREMAGLGWASFYYVFHLCSRALFFSVFLPLFTVQNLAQRFHLEVRIEYSDDVEAVLRIVLGVLVELIAWVGLFAYLYARRRGKLSSCRSCPNRRLAYLVVCPHCGK
jgi:hypothetical protein